MRSQIIFAFLVTLLFAVFIGFSLGAPLWVSAIVGSAIAVSGFFIKPIEGALNDSLAATLTQAYRSAYAARLDKNEQRVSNYGGLKLFKDQTASPSGIIDADAMEKIRRSFGNSVQIPVLNYQDVSIGNVRTCAIRTGGPTSALVSITFATYAFGFGMFPAQYYNNDIKYQEVFNRNMLAYETKLAAALDTAAIAKLESAKNSYFPTAITGTYYSVVNGALQVPQAQQAQFYNMVPSIMETMDFNGGLNDLTTPFAMAKIRNWAAQGQGNQTNTAFQFGGVDYYQSNRITNGAGVADTHYLVQDDTVAIVTRLDPDALAGSSVGGGQKKWGVERVPLIDMDMAVYYNEDCTNAAAIQSAGVDGLTRTKVESFEFSFDVAFVSVYNSRPSADYTPIIKAELLTT